ncbi:hypothetical protein AB6A40_004367, partial [Gnathostoma spinigerum]
MFSRFAWILVVFVCSVVERGNTAPCDGGKHKHSEALNSSVNDGKDQVYDVIIVGGGLAGLSAAHQLSKSNSTLQVLVLEARPRLGGRVHSVQLSNSLGQLQYFDIGGQWIGEHHRELLDLINEFQLSVRKQSSCGEVEILVDNWVVRKNSQTPMTSEFNHIKDDFVSVPTPGHSISQLLKDPSFSHFGDISVEQYLNSDNISDVARDGVNRILQIFYDAPASEMAALQLLLTANSENVSIFEFLTSTGNGDSYLIEGGMRLLIAKLTVGKEVKTNEIVLNITDRSAEEGVVYVNTLHNTYRAKDVIVAVPPVLMANITFTPPLDLKQQRLFENYRPRGDAFYFVITYVTPFWRNVNQNGQIVYSDEEGEGPIAWMTTFDSSSSSENISTGVCVNNSKATGVLYGIAHFISGIYVDEPVRHHQYLLVLARILGHQAMKPLDIKDIQWSNEEFSRGSVGALGPGQIPEQLIEILLMQPTDRIHFAGAEYSHQSMGFMNGAVMSGKQTANDVLTSRKIREQILHDTGEVIETTNIVTEVPVIDEVEKSLVDPTSSSSNTGEMEKSLIDSASLSSEINSTTNSEYLTEVSTSKEISESHPQNVSSESPSENGQRSSITPHAVNFSEFITSTISNTEAASVTENETQSDSIVAHIHTDSADESFATQHFDNSPKSEVFVSTLSPSNTDSETATFSELVSESTSNTDFIPDSSVQQSESTSDTASTVSNPQVLTDATSRVIGLAESSQSRAESSIIPVGITNPSDNIPETTGSSDLVSHSYTLVPSDAVTNEVDKIHDGFNGFDTSTMPFVQQSLTDDLSVKSSKAGEKP